YLAWGARQYGTSPVSQSRHDGWMYVVIESGSPTLVRNEKREKIEAPALILIGPNCAFGWADDAMQTSKLLTWRWTQPRHEGIHLLGDDSVVRHALNASDLADLRHLHALTRAEVHRSDAHSGAALEG